MSERNAEAPPVEALSDIAWQRVERGLFATLDCDASAPTRVIAEPRRRWTPWALAGGLAAAAAAILIVVLIGGDATPTPRTATGSGAPSRVVTQDAATEVSYGDATIIVGPESALTLHGDSHRGVLIVLERGQATFEVAPRDGHPPFVVEAGEVSVRVVGTQFTVIRNGDTARVTVVEGRVEVVSRGERAMVRAGEAWPTTAAVAEPEPEPEIVAPLPEVAEPTPTPPAKQPRARPTAGQDDRSRFEHAAALEASDPRAALREYRSLARRKGRWAANALYAAGRLADELGDRKGAIALLREYLIRFPEGGNAGNARELLDSLGK